jgi:hypothetical protein
MSDIAELGTQHIGQVKNYMYIQNPCEKKNDVTSFATAEWVHLNQLVSGQKKMRMEKAHGTNLPC